MTYFKYLPVELLAGIARKLPDVDALCEVIECTPSFWINLIKKVFPFAYKRDYNWGKLYEAILQLESDTSLTADDFSAAAGFYVYEGLASPKDYDKYIEILISTGDNLALSKVIEWYSKHPEGASKIDWDNHFINGLYENNLIATKQILVMMNEKGVLSMFNEYIVNTSKVTNDIADFIFDYPSLSSEERKDLIGYISNNPELVVNILDFIDKYKIVFSNSHEAISLFEMVFIHHKVPILKHILSSYPQYFEDVDSFEHLYDTVIDQITNRDEFSGKYSIIRSLFRLLDSFPTCTKLRELDDRIA